MSDPAEENLAGQICITEQKLKYQCSECTTSFETSEELESHNKTDHFREDAFPCPICGEIFREFCSLGNHMRMGHNDEAAIPFTEEFSCLECSKIFSETRDLKLHVKVAHNRTDAFKCTGCSRTFNRLINMNKHVRASHPEEVDIHMKRENKFPCALCSEKFEASQALKSHVLDVHKRKDAFKCPRCPKHFTELKSMAQHIKYVHTDEKKFSCHICPKQFQLNCNLNRHIKDVHEKEQNFLCQECPLKFSQKCTLERHMVSVHGKEGEFKCDQCSSSFTHASYLDAHVKVVHKGEKKFLCHNCPKSFLQKSQLKKHLDANGKACNNKKPREKIATGDNPLDCPICLKHFAFDYNVQRHVREVHEKEQNFKCQDCTLKFSQKATLDRHRVWVHKVEGNLKCDQCPLTFVFKFDLETHVKVVHCGEKRRRKSEKTKLESSKEVKSSESCDSSPAKMNVAPNHPTSPKKLLVNVVENNDVVIEINPLSIYPDDESSDDYLMETAEVSLADTVLSEMDENLKYRIYCTFKDHERSDFVSLIGKGVLNPADLISIVVNSDKANLKPVDLIIAIVEIFLP